MKMIATWFRARRGLAVGTIVGALTVGKATPYLVHAIPGAGITPVTLVASSGALLARSARVVRLPRRAVPVPAAAVLVGARRAHRARAALAARDRRIFGPHVGALRCLDLAPHVHRRERRRARPGRRRGGAAASRRRVAFAALAVGGLGCVWGGLVADRRGRAWLVTLAMAVSGACALLIGLTFGALALAARAGRARLGLLRHRRQRAVLRARHRERAARTRSAPRSRCRRHSASCSPPSPSSSCRALADALGWRWAFPVLALGPIAGIWAIRRLVALAPRADC